MEPINNYKELHGYIVGNYIALHRRACTNEKDINGYYIYEPKISFINPNHILCINTIMNFDGVKIHFITKDSDTYYESIEAIEKLLSKYYEREQPKNISSKVTMPIVN